MKGFQETGKLMIRAGDKVNKKEPKGNKQAKHPGDAQTMTREIQIN